jgi:hypothetical protein
MGQKGCGCVSFFGAVALGVVVGVIGLLVVGYFWVDKRVLSDAPLEISREGWSRLDEAALTLKLTPAALSIKRGKENEHSLSLDAEEANRLVDQYVLNGLPDSRIDLSFGDTTTIIGFSKKLAEGMYLNGELEAGITAKDGDFEVDVKRLKTGTYEWPRPFLPQVARWLEGTLETQTLFQNDPWRIMDYSVQKKNLNLLVRIVVPEPAKPEE